MKQEQIKQEKQIWKLHTNQNTTTKLQRLSLPTTSIFKVIQN